MSSGGRPPQWVPQSHISRPCPAPHKQPDSWEESRPLRARAYGILLRSLGVAPATDSNAGPDAGPNASPAAGSNAGPDADPDAGPNADPDAGPDAGPAGGPNAGPAGVNVVEWLRIGTNPLATVVVPVPMQAGDGLRDMDFEGRLTLLLAACHADHAAVRTLRPELQIWAAVVLYAWSVHSDAAELHALARAVAVAAKAGAVMGGTTTPTARGHIHVVARWRALLHGVGLLAEALEVTAGQQPVGEEGRALPLAEAWLLVPDALLYASLAGGAAAGGGAWDEGAGGGAALWAARPGAIVEAV